MRENNHHLYQDMLNIREIVLWFVLLVFFVIIVFRLNTDNYTERFTENFSDNIKWSRSESCKFDMNETINDSIKDFTRTNDSSKADIIFPCGYNNINDEINIIGKNNTPKRVFIIDGADEITAKNYLWKNIYQHHGLSKAKTLSPESYILLEPDRTKDLERLIKNHYQGKKYILKKNIQRQTGIKITDDINEIKNNINQFIIAQDLLEDSYLVNGRKINLRVYVIVICHEDKTDVYIFNNGFMYYTKDKFIRDNISYDNHVTTGYVDREVYTICPLTHEDFAKYLDLPEGDKYHKSNEPRHLSQQELLIRKQGLRVSETLFKRIKNLMSDVFISFKGKICRKIDNKNKEIPIYTDYSIQIFGADVAVNDQLQPQIIEINKGPDLSPKDDRDGTVKRKLINDTFEIIGLKSKSHNNGMIHVLSM